MTGTTTLEKQQQLQIGRYAVETKLGEGGMAYTWLCRLNGAKGFSKTVVVKTLKPTCQTPQFVTMFADEARIGSRFDHPNLSRILELGDAGGVPFLVQEFVDGPTLHQLTIRQAMRRQINVPFGCQVIAEIAGALHAVYNTVDEDGRRLNVVHRDVSLSNVLVSRQGIPKLIDFGVARFDGRETETEVGLLKGKFRYMAPEVMQRGAVSHQSDIYSLGICLYSLCAGPAAHREDALIRLADPSQSGLDPKLAAIVRGCLKPDPADRWQTGVQLKHALEEWLDNHGGRLEPAALAEVVADLFPLGPSEWRSDEMTMAFAKTELSSGLARVKPERSLRPILFALAALALLVPIPIASAIGVWLYMREPVAAVAPAPDPQREAIERAEIAIASGRVEEVSSALALLAPAALEPELRIRLDRINDQLVVAKLSEIRTLAERDLPQAIQAAHALNVLYPNHPDVSTLLASLEVRVLPVPQAPAPQAPAPPRPAKPAPADDLFGERIGRPPSP